jgi:hypothetical protein
MSSSLESHLMAMRAQKEELELYLVDHPDLSTEEVEFCRAMIHGLRKLERELAPIVDIIRSVNEDPEE